MTNRLLFLIYCLFVVVATSLGQTPTQTIRGIVRDKQTKQALPGAGIRVEAARLSARSDENGEFVLENVPAGRVHLQVESTGYRTYTPEDLLLLSTKALFIEIELTPADIALQETVIRAAQNAFEPVNGLLTLSARSITVDETERIATAVNDPGRAAFSYPGVQTGEDDSENQIVVRGNAPIGVLWRLEGIDIPNPNHFAVIGSSGGGITVFSAQLLSRSDFSTGAMPAEYGNAISGAFDVHFRQGDDERREYRVKAGLLGLDFATEGPIRRGQSSYLINYRYSTLGLLNQFGFNLVGERVSNDFQDLSFNLVFKSKNNRRIATVFGIGGLSEEHYYPVEDPLQRDTFTLNHWEDRIKPANMGVLGATWTFLPDDKSYFKVVAALMGSEIRRESDTLDRQNMRYRFENQRYLDRRLATTLTYHRKLSPRLGIKTGLLFNNVFFDFYKNIAPRSANSDINDRQDRVTVQGEGSTQLLQQYAQLQWQFSPRWALHTGYHLLHLFANGSTSAEPRLSVQYRLSENQRLNFSYGLHGKTLPLMTYYVTDTTGARVNKNLKMLKSHHFVLAWHLFAGGNLRLSAEAYAQRLFNVPVQNDPKSVYWMLNFSEGFPDFPTVSAGKGMNTGIDLAAEKQFSGRWFFLLNASVFSTRFELPGGLIYSTRFDSRFSSGLTLGKEFALRRGGIFQVGGRFLYRGGFRYTPYDPLQSAQAGRYVPLAGAGYTGKVPAYKRLDMRLAWRFNRKKASGNLSLDVQNALNQRNATNVGYNPLNNATFLEYRGELVPVLGFQVDF